MPQSSIQPDIFDEIHTGLPREGPGNFNATHRAFLRLTHLPESPDILDIGCGPGLQTIDLAVLSPQARIIALDNSKPYLEMLRLHAARENLEERIKTLHGSMFSLPFEDKSFDVLWAEGSIYIIGLEQGLSKWRRLLKPDGYIAFTHLSWLRTTAHANVRNFWNQHYPEMKNVQENLTVAQNAGYKLLDSFVLPESAWWDDYYRPLEKRLQVLRQKYKNAKAALERIEETQREIDLYRDYSDYYGYVFYILRKTGT